VRVNAPSVIAFCAVMCTAASGAAAGRDSRLVEAVKRQDTQAVQALLNQGVDVDAPQGDGATALHWAVYVDDPALTDLLIRARANVNATNDLGATPLFLACHNANGTIVGKLLTAGAKPNLPISSTGETPLMTAARAGGLDAVKALLVHGANVNAAETAHGQTALMWAAANGHPAVVKALVDGGAGVNARSRINRVLVMIGNRPGDFDAGGSTALLFAARRGDVASAKVLVAAGANVDDVTPDKTSVLVFAAHSGQGAFAEYLLDNGADPNADGSGYTALHAAVLRGDLPLVKALLAHHADPNAKVKQPTPMNRDSKDFAFATGWIDGTPFWLAAKFAEPEIMRALAAGGADPTLVGPNGITPLMAAAGVGRTGARDVDDRRGRRLDPIEIAELSESGDDERKTLEAVKLAFELGGGVNVNAASANGDAALHAAVANKDTSVVRWLADHGADLNAEGKFGNTPLSIAGTRTRGEADEGSVDTKMVELLLRLGAKEEK